MASEAVKAARELIRRPPVTRDEIAAHLYAGWEAPSPLVLYRCEQFGHILRGTHTTG